MPSNWCRWEMCEVSRLPSIACTQLQVVSCFAATNSPASRPSVPKSLNGRHRLARAHVGPDDPARLVHRVGLHPHLLAERRGLAGHVDALAVHVERPPVVHAAQRRALVAPEVQRRAPVRAVLLHQADPPPRVTERHQVLAEQPHPGGRAARLRDLRRQAGRRPVPAQQLAHQRSRTHPGQDLVVFGPQHRTPPPNARHRPRWRRPAFSPSHRPKNAVNYQIKLLPLYLRLMCY